MKHLSLSLALTLALAACGPAARAGVCSRSRLRPARRSGAAQSCRYDSLSDAARRCRDLRQLALGRRQGARRIPPSQGHARVLRRQAGPDPHRDHSRRWLVHRNPGAAAEGQRHLHRRLSGRSTSDYAKRSNEKFRAMLVVRSGTSRRGEDRRIRRQGTESRSRRLGRRGPDVPQRAQLGRQCADHVQGLQCRAQARRHARRGRSSRR